MKGAFRITVMGGGSTPDPAVYCPANDYYNPDDPDSPVIWNPIDPAEWTLLAEFQTNSPNSTTFDPLITASSGNFSWNLGDGTILMNQKAVTYTFYDSSTKTIKLYAKDTPVITGIDMSIDAILGTLDLSDDAFKSVIGYVLHQNPGLTTIVFPPTITAVIQAIELYLCGITGTLDLSMFDTFTTAASINIHTNSSLTGLTLANTISGAFSSINIYSTGILGTLDLSSITEFNSGSAIIRLYSNPSLTGVTFASSITGAISQLLIYSTGITGTLDLSKFTDFTATAAISLYSNPSLTGITFASSIAGTFSQIWIYSTGITGTLDLSKFTTFTATATVYLNNNTSMTGVTFPSSTITGFIRTLRLYSNTGLGYVDLTKLRTGVNSLNWDMKNNGWSAAIVNQVLVDIDSISVGGFTSRVINIGGTNADPDTTSGGYNGSAARTSLISKGFTVTIT